MDELELLKKDWKKQDANYPELSYNEIYKMVHKKSSSIVKWIFIISLTELLLWSLLNLFVPDKYLEIYEKFHLKNFLIIMQAIHYAIVMVFIYLFYKNYKRISVTDSINLLMQRIIKTRKTVNYYVYYNLILYAVLSVIINLIMFSNPETLVATFNPEHKIIDSSKFFNIMLIGQIIAFFAVIGLLWGYYKVIYGILLKRLNSNYKELETLND